MVRDEAREIDLIGIRSGPIMAKRTVIAIFTPPLLSHPTAGTQILGISKKNATGVKS
jgi:hypothetical protein